MNHNPRFIVLTVNAFTRFRKREVYLYAIPVKAFIG